LVVLHSSIEVTHVFGVHVGAEPSNPTPSLFFSQVLTEELPLKPSLQDIEHFSPGTLSVQLLSIDAEPGMLSHGFGLQVGKFPVMLPSALQVKTASVPL